MREFNWHIFFLFFFLFRRKIIFCSHVDKEKYPDQTAPGELSDQAMFLLQMMQKCDTREQTFKSHSHKTSNS